MAFAVGGADGHGRRRRVLDVGAGTGLLTGLLVVAGHDVVAIDPSAAMLAQLTARLPGVPALAGPAEALPVAGASFDVVVAGQAAHWFDPAAAAAEMRRVLRPGGAVGLLWNLRDDREPWVGEIAALLAAEGIERFSAPAVAAAFADALGAPAESTRTGYVQAATPEEFVHGLATRSYVITMPEPRRAAFLDRLRSLLATHPATRGRAVLEVPHVTTAYRLRPARPRRA